MLAGHIYVLKLPSGKMYVGQTIQSVENRVAHEIREAERGSQRQPFLFNAIRKYGRTNVSLLCSYPIQGEQEDLDAAEIRYIRHYNTLAPYGYNIREGGRGGSHSKEARAKMSAAHKGKKLSEETKEKISLAGKGRRASKETKKKLSQNNARYWKGRATSDEVKAKISIALKGVSKSEEHKANMRRPKSTEHRTRISIAMRGKSKSKEHKIKISEARKGKPRSKETRAKISATMRKRSKKSE